MLHPTPPPWMQVWRGWPDSRQELLDRYQQRRMRVEGRWVGRGRSGVRPKLVHVDWARVAPDLALYLPAHLGRLIRMEGEAQAPSGGVGGGGRPLPTLPASWLRARDGHGTDYTEIQLHHQPPAAVPETGGSGGGGSVSGGVAGAARALSSAIALLALLALLARLADKYLDWVLCKMRSRQSREWPTPNVLATSHVPRIHTEAVPIPPEEQDVSSDLPPPSPRTDAPPPYWSCTPAPPEDPPPPYSSCYVAYCNPKDGIPSVHFYNGQRQKLFAETGPDDTGQSSSDVNSGSLVLENGRVIDNDVATRVASDDAGDNAQSNSVVAADDSNETSVVGANNGDKPSDKVIFV